jgi:hypothetical protein
LTLIDRKSTTVGEVVQTSLTIVLAQAPELSGAPAFGEIVRIGGGSGSESTDPFSGAPAPSGTVYGIVFSVTTGSLDPTRRPTAYGMEPDQLLREQPQVFSLLQTEYECLLLAHVSREKLRHSPPNLPPELHTSVRRCDEAELERLTEKVDGLWLASTREPRVPVDALLEKFAQTGYEVRGHSTDYLIQLGRDTVRYLSGDADRALRVIERLAAIPED